MRCSANSSVRFWLHDGQREKPLQEKRSRPYTTRNVLGFRSALSS